MMRRGSVLVVLGVALLAGRSLAGVGSFHRAGAQVPDRLVATPAARPATTVAARPATTVAARPATTAAARPATTLAARSASSAGTVAALRHGHWSAIPRAPIVARQGATVVWDGRELLVWGGAHGFQGEDLRSDGAAYDPATGRWRRLPRAPVAGRDSQAGVWTGHELFVWGGYTYVSSGQLRVAADGAVYDPATNSWRRIAPAPLAPRADAFAFWTGSEVVVLGGHPAVMTARLPSFADGASYDPSRNRWSYIVPPADPHGYRLDWVAAVQTPGHLVAWSNWSTSRRIGPNTWSENGGTDVFDYDEHAGRWRYLLPARNELPSVETALWTGRRVIARGLPYNCGDCPGPLTVQVLASFDPRRDAWTRLSPGPFGLDYFLPTWTGRALVAMNGGIDGPLLPGDSAVFDPSRNRWSRLPRAPMPCDALLWTGRQLLGYCPGPGLKPQRYDGVRFTPGRAHS